MKICTVTGSRAEFYILKNLIRKLEKNKYFNQHLIVTGSHNLKTFGNTIKEINNIPYLRYIGSLKKKNYTINWYEQFFRS